MRSAWVSGVALAVAAASWGCGSAMDGSSDPAGTPSETGEQQGTITQAAQGQQGTITQAAQGNEDVAKTSEELDGNEDIGKNQSGQWGGFGWVGRGWGGFGWGGFGGWGGGGWWGGGWRGGWWGGGWG